MNDTSFRGIVTVAGQTLDGVQDVRFEISKATPQNVQETKRRAPVFDEDATYAVDYGVSEYGTSPIAAAVVAVLRDRAWWDAFIGRTIDAEEAGDK